MSVVPDPRLDIFERPSMCASIIQQNNVKIKPLNALTNHLSPIQFEIPSIPDCYIDPSNCFLKVSVQVLNADLTAITPPAAATATVAAVPAAIISPSCNFMHSLFSEVEVYANNVLISNNSNLYAYKSFFMNLFGFGESSKSTELITEGWLEDKPGERALDTGESLLERAKWIKFSKTFYMYGRIKSELFQIRKFIPSGIDITIRLVQNKPSCVLYANAGQPVCKILDATFNCCYAKLDNEVLAAQEETVSKSNFLLPHIRTQMKVFNIPSGYFNKEVVLHSGKLGGRVTIGFVENSTLAGDYSKDMFNFKNFGIDELYLTVNSVKIPTSGLKFDFTSGDFNEGYLATYQALKTYARNKSNGLTKEAYKNGSFITQFDITKDLSFAEGPFGANEVGTVSLYVSFNAALSAPVSVIVMFEHESVLGITKHREIILDA
jgi:hypothetical protein